MLLTEESDEIDESKEETEDWVLLRALENLPLDADAPFPHSSLQTDWSACGVPPLSLQIFVGMRVAQLFSGMLSSQQY